MTDGRSARFELLYRTHYRAVAAYVGRRLRADLVEDPVTGRLLDARATITDDPQSRAPVPYNLRESVFTQACMVPAVGDRP